MSELSITDHAYRRAKERLSWSGSALERTAAKAFESGLRHSDTTGNLHKFIYKIHAEYGTVNNLRIYSDAVFLFAQNVLITVYPVPPNLRGVVHKILKSKSFVS